MTDKQCKISDTAWIAPSADVLGNVTIGRNSSVWFHATVRAERDSIYIGEHSNIQDNCVLHVDAGNPIHIGDYVTIGHGAVVHGCTVGDESLIGMGATVLNGARLGSHCMVGAGSLVTQNMEVPDGYLALGVPAKLVRPLSTEEIAGLRENALTYVEEMQQYQAEQTSDRCLSRLARESCAPGAVVQSTT